MPDTVPEAPQPALRITYETIEFTRSDGDKTIIQLLPLLDNEDPKVGDTAGIAWAILLRLQGIFEYQDLQVKLMAEMAKAIAAQGAILQKLAEAPAEAPDPMEMITKAMEKLGINPEMVQKMMGGASNGVSVEVTRPGEEGA